MPLAHAPISANSAVSASTITTPPNSRLAAYFTLLTCCCSTEAENCPPRTPRVAVAAISKKEFQAATEVTVHRVLRHSPRVDRPITIRIFFFYAHTQTDNPTPGPGQSKPAAQVPRLRLPNPLALACCVILSVLDHWREAIIQVSLPCHAWQGVFPKPRNTLTWLHQIQRRDPQRTTPSKKT
jgi:hypothetical protein